MTLTSTAKLAGRKRRRPGDIRADINVTPLVDVVLVLLIIFMVVAPMISQRLPVELPRTQHHDRKPDDGKDVMVSITRQGQIYFAANPVALGQVAGLVEQQHRQAPTRKVYLQGDSFSRFGVARQVMQAIRKGSSVDQVLLRTDERKPAAQAGAGAGAPAWP